MFPHSKRVPLSFLILFNFQGPSCASLRDSLFIISGSVPFVKNFFRYFFQPLSLSSRSLLSLKQLIDYIKLRSLCQELFSIFLSAALFRTSVRGSFYILSDFIPLVNSFFLSFTFFFFALCISLRIPYLPRKFRSGQSHSKTL